MTAGGARLTELAVRFGTPAQVLDEAEIRLRCQELLAAVRRVPAHPNLVLAGSHCHLGSRLSRVASFEEAARRMVEPHAASTGSPCDSWISAAGSRRPTCPATAASTSPATRRDCAWHCATSAPGTGFPLPCLVIEPGRSIVATAGVPVYRVITVKRGPTRTFVAVDGGMSDSPRPALYGARYTVRMVELQPGRPAAVREGSARLVVRRESEEDIPTRDLE